MSKTKLQCGWDYVQLRRRRQPRSRNSRMLVNLVVLLCAVAGLVRGLSDLHDIHVKYQPSSYSSLAREFNATTIPRPEQPVRTFNGSHIDDRYAFVKALTHGEQGSVYLYADLEANGTLVVVKEVSTTTNNALPPEIAGLFDEYTDKWPSELHATLSLGDVSHSTSPSYVPIYDYFILHTQARAMSEWRWAIVTPFVAGGTLLDLAARIRRADLTTTASTTTTQIDAAHRGALDALLASLEPLHAAGYCHDDVKPDNVFARAPTRWLLADMGQLRGAAHPWHGTRLWRRRNQLPDCRLNDVRRALRTYLSFVRAASADPAVFDDEFNRGATAWAKLYWNFVRDPAPAAATLAMSRSLPWDGAYRPSSSLPRGFSLWPRAGHGVERELRCTSIPWSLWWAW